MVTFLTSAQKNNVCGSPNVKTHLLSHLRTTHPTGVFTLRDMRAFSELTSKIPPLGSTVNFDADVKRQKDDVRHQCENRQSHCAQSGPRPVTTRRIYRSDS